MAGSVPDTAEIDDDCDDQPQNVDAFERHGIVHLPGVNNRGDGKEEEAENRNQQLMVKGALQIVGKEPHQQKYDTREKQHQAERKSKAYGCHANKLTQRSEGEKRLNMKTSMRRWQIPLMLFSVLALLRGAEDNAPFATLVAQESIDRLYPIMAQGSGVVRWRNGAFVFYTGSHFFTINTEGDLTADVRLDMPDDARYNIVDYDRKSDGTIVAAAIPDANFSDVSPFLVWIAPDGKTERLVRTAPYYPHSLTFAQDGTVWTLGYEMINGRLKDPSLDPKDGVLRQFDRGGKIMASALPQEEFLKPEWLGRVASGKLAAVREHLAWYSCVRGKSRYVEIPTDKIEMHVFPGVSRELANTGKWDGDVDGFTVTDTGDAVVSISGPRSRQTFIFDRAGTKWMKLAVAPMGVSARTFDPNLVGSDGNRLVFSAGVNARFDELTRTDLASNQ